MSKKLCGNAHDRTTIYKYNKQKSLVNKTRKPGLQENTSLTLFIPNSCNGLNPLHFIQIPSVQ